MTAQLSPTPVFKAFSNDGQPLAYGFLTTYAAGTTVKQATYIDSTQTTQNSNPIRLNFRGECALWLDPTLTYKFVLTDFLGNTIPGYPVDNIPGGLGSLPVSGSLIPNPTNTWTLGNSSFSWANLYLGPNNAPAFDSVSGNIGYYARTAAEIAASVTPVNYSYPPGPWIDSRRYGAAGDGKTDDTQAFQSALKVAQQSSGQIVIPGNFVMRVGSAALSLIFSGTHTTEGFSIVGMAPVGSTILYDPALGTQSAALTIQGSQITSGSPEPTEVQLTIANLSIVAASAPGSTDGLLLYGVANFHLSNVVIVGFNRNLNLNGSLVGTIDQGCQFMSGSTGIYARAVGSGVGTIGPNLITLDCIKFNFNTGWGLDYDQGSMLRVMGCDCEGNGTASNYATGGIHIGPNICQGEGSCNIEIDGVWMEANVGNNLLIEAPNASQGLNTVISISNTQITNEDITHTIQILGGLNVSLDSVRMATSGATSTITATNIALRNCWSLNGTPSWVLGASYCLIENSQVYTLNDASVTYPTYTNVTTNAVTHVSGRQDTSVTLTGTGFASAPTATPVLIQQGLDVTLVMPLSTGTSNATTYTLTGLPARYQPPGTPQDIPVLLEDNGTQFVGSANFAAGSGTITLNKPGGSFTASGTKGIMSSTLKYRLQ